MPSVVFSGRWRSETRQCGSCLSGVLTLTFCRNPGRERVFKDLQLLGNFSKTQVIMKTHQERDNRMAGGGGGEGEANDWQPESQGEKGLEPLPGRKAQGLTSKRRSQSPHGAALWPLG